MNKAYCLIFLIFNCSGESELEGFVNKLIFQNKESEFVFLSPASKPLGLATRTSQALIPDSGSNFSKTYFTNFENFINLQNIIIIPENMSRLSSILEQVDEFYYKSLGYQIYKPFIFILWPKVSNIPVFMKNITELFKPNYKNIRLDSDVFFILKTIQNKTIQIISVFEMYYLKTELRIQQTNVGNLFNLPPYFSKAVHRQNFQMVNIIAIGLADPDYQHQCKLEEVNGTLRFVSGFAVEILHALTYALNFSHTAVKGEGWIEQLENGSWTGMGRQIKDGEADLAISQSTLIPYRFKALGFLHPTTTGQLKAFFRQPHSSTLRDIFISPFNIDLWICLLASWLLLIACIMSFYWIGLKYTDAEVQERDEELVDQCILWTIGTLCQQGWHSCPSIFSLRIVLLSGSLLGLFYYVAFSAALVSTLSVDIVPIRSMEDLSHSQLEIWGDFWIPNKYSVVQGVLEKRQNPVNMSENEQYIEIDHALPKLLKKSAAFLTFSDAFLSVYHRLNYSDHYYCDTFSSLGVLKSPTMGGMIVQKGSPYKEVLNHKIVMMRERGIITRLNYGYIRGTSAMCPVKTSQYRDKLGIYDVFTAYLILFSGFSASFLGIILEITLKNITKLCL